MTIHKTITGLVLLSFLLCFSTTALCQQEDDSYQDTSEHDDGDYYDESAEFSFGTIIKVEGNTLTVSEDGYSNDTNTKVLYVIDEETQFVNTPSLAEIKEGDTAFIDYVEKSGKRIAQNIEIESEEIE